MDQVAVKRKSPRKDHNRPIENVEVLESELAELEERKALHEAWAAFRLEHRETIENHLPVEDYDWLEREIPQAVKPIGLKTPAELWEKAKGSKIIQKQIASNNKLLAKAKKRITRAKSKISSLEDKLKNIDLDTRIGFLRGQERSGIKKERKKAQKELNKIKKDKKKTNNQISRWKKIEKFFEKLSKKMEKRNKKLKNFLRLRNVKTGEKWAAFRAEHQETIAEHLSEEDYAWLEREIPQAIKPTVLGPLWERSGAKLDQKKKKTKAQIEKVKKDIKLLESKIRNKDTRVGFLIGQMRSNNAVARKAATAELAKIRSGRYERDLNIQIKNKKWYLGVLNSLYKTLGGEISSGARLLTAQEEKDVIFW